MNHQKQQNNGDQDVARGMMLKRIMEPSNGREVASTSSGLDLLLSASSSSMQDSVREEETTSSSRIIRYRGITSEINKFKAQISIPGWVC